ncbi:hypothetical protein V6N12_049208 [Hibiscus sabdariffa]|uniref:Uncharacterized protein n=1 Tax=Hibiscus sabdariffa TaxID=183260 RepID=A0ABR2EJY0_9ROSI
MKEGQKNYRTTPTRAKGRPKGLAEKTQKIDRRELRRNTPYDLRKMKSVPHSARKLGGVSYEGQSMPFRFFEVRSLKGPLCEGLYGKDNEQNQESRSRRQGIINHEME